MTASHPETSGEEAHSSQPDPERAGACTPVQPAPDDQSVDDKEDAAGNPRTAARRLASGLDPDARDYGALRRLLANDLGTTLSFMSDEIADVVDEAIARFHAAAIEGRVEQSTALAYLRRMAHNEAVDRLRRSRSN